MFLMGIAYAIQGKFDQAEKCFNKALELSPNNENIKFNLESMKKDRAARAQQNP